MENKIDGQKQSMQGIDRQYGWDFEDLGYSKLEELNEKLRLENLGRTPKNWPSGDASGTSFIGDVNIEIKVRDLNIDPDTLTFTGHTGEKQYTGNTLYIETHKIGDMLLDYVCDGKIPLYVNFLNDGYVVIYNLKNLKSRPNGVVKRIYSNLYKSYENARRIELPLTEAYIYRKEDKQWRTIKY